MAFERKLYVIRKRAENAIRYSGKVAGGEFFYISSLSFKTLVYKGMLLTTQLTEYYPDLVASGDGVGAGAGPFAVQHQYFPELEPGPSVSLHGPQRRDQYLARQYQLDARAPGVVRIGPVWRRHQENSADRLHGRQRFGHVRQLPGVAGAGRALAAARHDDDDPGAMDQAREHERREKGVLRISFLPDGTVGRPGFDRLYGRQENRRGAGSQRSAPSRYYVTKDDLVIMASEVGVLDVPPERVLQKGGCSLAACSSSTPSKGALSPTKKSNKKSPASILTGPAIR